ncbi:MAG: asparagine synthase (glutamine-hydrolyzing) [Magnetococcales bacterium]|nr:asparagine synthase (glutamine-hydrolyzing) [Magnetococcales bacterium]
MCGIAGVCGEDYDLPFPLHALAHRGPDARGEWRSSADRVWLGHRRLAILDLSPKGHQPMSCLDHRYQVVFNGEIYNFLALRSELEDVGYVFRSESDTEVIAAAFDRWGEACQHRFNGMWAFALWDTRDKILFLSRDRYGKKPLYFHHREGNLSFASEVQALHRWQPGLFSVNEAVVRRIGQVVSDWHGTAETYLNQVSTLPGGCCLRWDGRRAEQRVWYRLRAPQDPIPADFEGQARHLRVLLEESCQLRLQSDVPLGTCLSGGLDSSTITALVANHRQRVMARSAKGEYAAFCVSFPGTTLDEVDKARQLARHLHIDLRVLEVEPPQPDDIQGMIADQDGPVSVLGQYPIWKLFEFIRGHGVKVTLDGQGPDEIMGGYFSALQPALESALRPFDPLRFMDLWRTYARQGENAFDSRFASASRVALSLLKRRFLPAADGGAISPGPENGSRFSHSLPAEETDPFRLALYRALMQDSIPPILQHFDRCSMAHGVENRMPFMDYRLVEFVMALPNDSRVGRGFSKRILRHAVRDIVPDFIRTDRRKIGFNAPTVEWFLGPLRQMMSDIMSSSLFLQDPAFDGPFLRDDFQRWCQRPQWGESFRYWGPVDIFLWRQHVSGFHRVSGQAGGYAEAS